MVVWRPTRKAPARSRARRPQDRISSTTASSDPTARDLEAFAEPGAPAVVDLDDVDREVAVVDARRFSRMSAAVTCSK